MKNLKKYGFNTNKKVYSIAEIGINHNGQFDKAIKLVDSALKTGVNAVKFQTYITEKRVNKNSGIFEILKRCELSFKEFQKINEYCYEKKIDFFSTPFDLESLDFLISLNIPHIKIASFDSINEKFLESISKSKKNLILSIGMSNLIEIQNAYNILTKHGSILSLLHCISSYPTKEIDTNLSAIYSLKKNFDCVVGYSDHTNGIKAPLYAIAAGAQIIEKHYKINDTMDCVDSAVSINENQMKKMIEEINVLENILGEEKLELRPTEIGTKIFRRFSKI